jgi:predicted patatin/cPLA2 family phospholipase
LELFLRKYPNLVDDLKARHKVYNNTLDLIAEKEKAGDFFVFRPNELEIDRFSKDPEQLEDLYDSGCQLAEEKSEELNEWLHKVKTKNEFV